MTFQCEALRRTGFRVRLIVGAGDAPNDVELARIPELSPAHPEIVAARRSLGMRLPGPRHPLVQRVMTSLREALRGSQQCWVHNALTVYLNPFLTVALMQLARTQTDIRWVVWCHDLSDASRYWTGPGFGEVSDSAGFPDAVFVTISHARRQELAALLHLPEEAIRVIPPAVDFFGLLGSGTEARDIATLLRLDDAEPVVLVPAKLLPHKRLELAVRLAAGLRGHARRPLVLITGAASPHQPDESTRVRDELEALVSELDAGDAIALLSDLSSGALQEKTVRELMLLSDLVFLPSTEEGFGVPISEAAALRVPVLCTDIPSFREAGGASAEYFPVDASIDRLVSQVLRISSSPMDAARRKALRSQRVLQDQIEQLARSTATNGRHSSCSVKPWTPAGTVRRAEMEVHRD